MYKIIMNQIDTLENVLIHFDELDIVMADILEDGNLRFSKNMQFEMEDIKAYAKNSKDILTSRIKSLYEKIKKINC